MASATSQPSPEDFSHEQDSSPSSGSGHQSQISKKNLNATRANSLSSTGPTSVLGKSRSRRNGLKHGLLANEIILGLEGEDKKEFEELLVQLQNHFKPAGPVENYFVQVVARCFWREKQQIRAENGEVDLQRNLAISGPRNCPHRSHNPFMTWLFMRTFREAMSRDRDGRLVSRELTDDEEEIIEQARENCRGAHFIRET